MNSDFDSQPKKPPLNPKRDLPTLDLSPVETDQDLKITAKRPKKRLKRLFLALVLVVLALLAGGGAYVYVALQPVDGNTDPVKFEIKEGQTAKDMFGGLKQQNLIRDSLVFELYFKFNHRNAKVKAGRYSLNSAMSAAEISQRLTGEPEQNLLKVTIYPGTSLHFRSNVGDSTPSIEEALALANPQFSQAAVKESLTRQLKNPFVTQFGQVETLEGLIFGETFHFDQDATLDQVFEHNFQYYQKILNDNQIFAGFERQGLTPYQGLTMASIVEREASGSSEADKKQVAQVFLKRWREGIQLGSDVTYQYASRLAGKENDLFIDSPYNTRKYVGIPPTPICSPSLASLRAVAAPADTDYLYFVSGDDGVNYFSHTEAEHEANVAAHCKIGCARY